MHTTIVAGKLDGEEPEVQKTEEMADSSFEYKLSEAQMSLVTQASPDIVDLAKCFINVNSISGTETPMADLMELWFNSREIEYTVDRQEVEPEKFTNKGVRYNIFAYPKHTDPKSLKIVFNLI